jgi:hypothetical protein
LDRLVRGVYEETRTYSLESTDHIQRFGEFKEDELEPAPAPWKLPEPPEGRWHRVDWEEAELPQGWRPLLDGELPQRGDLAGEKDSWSPRTGQFNIPVTSENSEGKFVFLKHKTLRPLPAPSTPETEDSRHLVERLRGRTWGEMINVALDFGLELNTARQERDAALARASEAEKRADERIAGYRDTAIEALEKARSHELELTTLRASVPVWVPLEAGKPTEGDRVIWTGDGGRCEIERVGDRRPYWSTHWMHLPLLPPLPVETGEDAFEKWWTVISQDWTGIQSAQWFAEQAWQAALSSTKP